MARQELGALPDRVVVGVSGSILKNVKSVIVPNTGHMKGIAAAAAAGIVAGDAKKELEVISQVSEEQIKEIREFLDRTDIRVEHIDNGLMFEILITMYKGEDWSRVRIANYHTNVVLIEKNLDRTDIRVEHIDNGLMFEILITMYKGEDWSRVRIANYHTNVVLIEKNGVVKKEVKVEGESEKGLTDRSCLSMEGIWDFINTADLDDLKQVLKRQASYNMAIAKEGMTHSYGANVGKSLASCVENREADSDTDISILARAMAAAGSDARMDGCELPVVINSGSGNQGITVSVPVRAMAAAGSDARMDGCELPVVINSGSGNQGITVSVPVLVYADRLHAGEEKTYRALALSNLTAIYQKTPIGRLSAFCGAVSAGAGNAHRPSVCFLRSCQCGGWGRSGNCLLKGRRFRGRMPDCQQHSGRHSRYDLRRSQAVLRGKDRHGCGGGNHGLPHERRFRGRMPDCQQHSGRHSRYDLRRSQAVLRGKDRHGCGGGNHGLPHERRGREVPLRRRNRRGGRGRDHQQHGKSGQRGNAGHQRYHYKNYDRGLAAEKVSLFFSIFRS